MGNYSFYKFEYIEIITITDTKINFQEALKNIIFLKSRGYDCRVSADKKLSGLDFSIEREM